MRYKKDKNGKVINVEFDNPGNYSRTIRYNSPEYVVKLAKYIKDKYNANYLYFLDENLMTMDVFSKRIWMKEICKLWKEYGLVPKKKRDGSWEGLHWSGTSHATLCEPVLAGLSVALALTGTRRKSSSSAFPGTRRATS